MTIIKVSYDTVNADTAIDIQTALDIVRSHSTVLTEQGPVRLSFVGTEDVIANIVSLLAAHTQLRMTYIGIV